MQQRHYKVVSKIIAKRLKATLHEAIHLNQCVFVEGRLLLENVLLATELVKDYHKSSISSNSSIKLDISKAFDTVSWEFIEKYACNGLSGSVCDMDYEMY